MNKQELLSNLRTGHERLQTALAAAQAAAPGISMDQAMLENGWTIKDLLAHIGFWEMSAVDNFQSLLSGKKIETVYTEATVDEINAQVYAEHHGQTFDQAQAWENECFQSLLAATENASDMDLFNPHRFGWTNGRPFYEWIIGNAYEHYDEHLVAVQKWMGAQKH
jgi:hypothetical protein